MTNNIFMIDFNGVKVVKDSNTKIIGLVSPGGAGHRTCHDLEGNNYQVPTGKKATIIYFDTEDLNGTEDIYYSDALDLSTNPVTLITPLAGTKTNFIFISQEIPADKYINLTNGTRSPEFWIVEESAT